MQQILEDLKHPEVREWLTREAELEAFEDALEAKFREIGEQLVPIVNVLKQRPSRSVRRAVSRACLPRYA